MGVILSDLIERFPEFFEFRKGRIDAHIVQMSHFSSILPESIVFVSNIDQLHLLTSSYPCVIVLPKPAESRIEEIPENFTVLLSREVKLAMAIVAQTYFPHPFAKQIYSKDPIHPSAYIDLTAKIGKNVIIGPHAFVGREAKINDNVFIGANSVIEAGCSIGEFTHIHSLVYLAYDTQIGRFCEILPQSSIGSEGFGYATDSKGKHHRVTHYGRVVIEDFVHIGSCVCIDRGTFKDSVIGSGSKIDNLCHFAHNINIGKNCLITAGFISAGSVHIGNNVVMGGRTTVAGHISICDNVQAAGLSGIHNNVKKPGAYGGYPFVELKDFLRMQASIVHLPKIRRNLARVMKKLGLVDEKER